MRLIGLGGYRGVVVRTTYYEGRLHGDVRRAARSFSYAQHDVQQIAREFIYEQSKIAA